MTTVAGCVRTLPVNEQHAGGYIDVGAGDLDLALLGERHGRGQREHERDDGLHGELLPGARPTGDTYCPTIAPGPATSRRA